MEPDPHAVQAKADLRRRMRQRLASLDSGEARRRSLQACDRLLREPVFQSTRTVMLYMPLPGEVDVASVALRCFQTGRRVCVPRLDWEDRRIIPVEIHDYDTESEQRRFGVREPMSGRIVSLDEIDLTVTPGLAFDHAGGRLGRGGGFYDRFLDRLPSGRKWRRCGLCFDVQLVPQLPIEEHDARVDVVVTDERTIHARRN